MHELAVTQQLLGVALDAAVNTEAQRITAINLVIGDLSSFVYDSVQFYFDFLSRGTLAEGALLHFERRPATATCLACDNQFTVGVPLPATCPACNSPRLQVTGGREFRVESIEIDKA